MSSIDSGGELIASAFGLGASSQTMAVPEPSTQPATSNPAPVAQSSPPPEPAPITSTYSAPLPSYEGTVIDTSA